MLDISNIAYAYSVHAPTAQIKYQPLQTPLAVRDATGAHNIHIIPT